MIIETIPSIIEGPQGPQGPQGVQGLQGIPGDPGAVTMGTVLISGATLAWVSGYTYRVGAAEYYIAGEFYTSLEQQVTLDEADETYDRIDVLALNSSGTLVIIKGTPAQIPSMPIVDPLTYVQLTFAFIEAASTEAPVINEDIYLEGVEWTVTPSAGSIVVGSTNNPRTGTKCIEGTAVTNGTYFTAVSPASLDLASYNSLILYIRLKAAWNTKRTIRFGWYLGTSLKGTSVTVSNKAYGLDVTNITTYQQIVIPLRDFTVQPGVLVDRFRVEMVGTQGDNVGFYIDDVFLQAGMAEEATARLVNYRGAWSSAISYADNDTVFYDNSSYICLLPHVNQVPSSTSIYWGVMALGPQLDSLISTGNVVAANSSQTFNKVDWLNRGMIYHLKIEETGGLITGTYDIEIYGKDTFLVADLMYKATDIYPSPIFEDWLPWYYQDLDGTGELHLKITNHDLTQQGTFSLTLNAEKYS